MDHLSQNCKFKHVWKVLQGKIRKLNEIEKNYIFYYNFWIIYMVLKLLLYNIEQTSLVCMRNRVKGIKTLDMTNKLFCVFN